MARMSHDDSVGRDSRFDHLAMLVGWSKRETVGCLQLDVWPMCYDRVAPYLTILDIDIAANRTAISPVKHPGGFSGAMIEARLARPATKADTSFTWKPKGWKEGDPVYTVSWPDQDWRGKIYLSGTAERIAYLSRSKLSGSMGGRKSAESRASKKQPPFQGALNPPSKGMSDGGQGSTNPPDTVPDTVPASASASAPDPDPPPDGDTALRGGAGGKASPPARAKQDRGAKLPAGWVPSRCEANIEAEKAARERGVDLKLELKKLTDWAVSNGETKKDWEATWRNWTRNAKPPSGQRRGGGGDVFTYLEGIIENSEPS